MYVLVHCYKNTNMTSRNSIDFLIGEPDKLQSVENECYGVLGGGVPQSIELKDNAAYSSVLQTQSAPHSQSIAVNDNVAYGTTTEETDQSYEYL